MPMKNPPHPGHSIKDACLDPLGLSVTEAAQVLGIARHTLSRVLNGRAGISAEMAIRLEKIGAQCGPGVRRSSQEARRRIT
jgi:antitoxin HigA-1